MKTLVFGASLKPERYSHIALNMLLEYGHDVVAIGGREGKVSGVKIQKGHPALKDIETITLYMGAARQEEHFDYLIGLSPKRVIFNPGTENVKFEQLLQTAGIFTQRACTLVLLRTEQYAEMI